MPRDGRRLWPYFRQVPRSYRRILLAQALIGTGVAVVGAVLPIHSFLVLGVGMGVIYPGLAWLYRADQLRERDRGYGSGDGP